MKWIGYKEHLREEWAFHKRHPELLLVWVAYLAAIIYCLLA
jgi:hypothetical protein